MREDAEMTQQQPYTEADEAALAAEMTDAHAEAVEHEVSSFADLARGVRVFLKPDGTTREEPIE